MNRYPEIRAFYDRMKLNPTVGVLLSLTADSAVYLVGGLLIGLGNVILVPLYTRTLAPKEFGVYALLDVTVLLIVTISVLKIDVSYLKWFADLDPSRHGELLGTTLLAVLLASALTGSLLTLYLTSRASESWFQSSTRGYAWFLGLIVVFECLQALFLTDLRARRRPIPYVACATLRLGGMIAVSYFLLVYQRLGLQGLFLGRLVGDAAAIMFLLSVSARNIICRFSLSLLAPMLRFGLPLVWSVLLMMLQDASGRYFLGHYRTLEEVGLLGAAIKVGAVFQVLFGQPFGLAWGGILFQVAKERDAQVIYSKIFAYVYALALGLALVLTISGRSLFQIFTVPAYYPAIVLLPWVLLVRAMNVIEQPAATGIYLSGRTQTFAFIYSIAMVVNLGALWAFVPRYGAVGVAWAWFLGSVLVPILNVIFGQRTYPLKFSARFMSLAALPWVLALARLPEHFGKGLPSRLTIEGFLCLVVAIFLGALVAQDLRGVRQQLQNQREATTLERVSL